MQAGGYEACRGNAGIGPIYYGGWYGEGCRYRGLLGLKTVAGSRDGRQPGSMGKEGRSHAWVREEVRSRCVRDTRRGRHFLEGSGSRVSRDVPFAWWF